MAGVVYIGPNRFSMSWCLHFITSGLQELIIKTTNRITVIVFI